MWLDTVVLAGRSTGVDVYTLCDDAALASISHTLRDHLHAARWAQALQCCADACAHAAAHAPQWHGQALRWQARVQAQADTALADGPAAGATPIFTAQALDKT